MVEKQEKDKGIENIEKLIKGIEEKTKGSRRQRTALDLTKTRMNEAFGALKISEKIINKIVLFQVINHGVFTNSHGASKMYEQSSKFFLSFVEDLGKINNFGKSNDDIKKKIKIFLSFLPNEKKEELDKVFSELLNNIYENLQPPADQSKANDFAAFLNDARSIFTQINGIAEEKLKLEQTVGSLGKKASIFTDKAKNYRSNAGYFLIGAASIIFLTVVFLTMILFFGNTFSSWLPNFLEKDLMNYGKEFSVYTEKPSKSLYFYLTLKMLISGRVLMSILLIAGFFYCLRFYAANNHNAIICDQRANTLESVESLYAASEGENKKLILEKALDSATAHQPTGFSKQQSNNDVQSVLSLLSKIIPFTGMGRTGGHKE